MTFSVASTPVADVLLKGSLAVLLVLCCTRLLARRPAALRHALWCLAFGGLVLVALAPVALPVWPLEVLPRPGGPPGVAGAPGVPAAGAGPAAAPDPAAPPGGVGGTVQPAPPVMADADPRPPGRAALPIAAAWAIGALLVGLRAGLETAAAARIGRAGAAPPPGLRGGIAACHARLRLASAVPVAFSGRVSVPMVAGVLRPCVLLPAAAREWPPERFRLAVLHELAHVHRRDHLTSLLGRLGCALHWPNPLVWLAAARLYDERERACDAVVLRSGTDRVGYARSLLDAARDLALAHRGATVAMAHRRRLGRRISSILDQSGAERLPSRGVLAAVAAAAAALLIGLAVVDLRPAPARGSERAPLAGLIADLERAPSGARLRAAWALGEREDAAAVPALAGVLDDPDAELRGLAAWALGEIKEPASLPALVAALDDPDPLVREMVARAVGELELAAGAGPLAERLSDPVAAVRSAAVWGLGEIATPAALEAARRALEDPSAAVRRSAVGVLGRIGGGSRLAGLIAAAGDRDPAVRRQTALRLGELGDAAAVTPLVELLGDRRPSVRAQAARSLGRIGSPQAVGDLIGALRDPDESVRRWATWAIDEINLRQRS